MTAHLKRHGIDPGEVRRRYGAEGYGSSIYITDPDGNTVELKGPPEPRGLQPAPQRTLRRRRSCVGRLSQ